MTDTKNPDSEILAHIDSLHDYIWGEGRSGEQSPELLQTKRDFSAMREYIRAAPKAKPPEQGRQEDIKICGKGEGGDGFITGGGAGGEIKVVGGNELNLLRELARKKGE